MTDARIWRAGSWVLVAFFLTSIARFYHPGFGFTALIAFPAADEGKHPALRAIPHLQSTNTYDGQFYAQLALEPLLRDRAIDFALDQPPYRARRILFSWTAYVMGLGRPAWIITAYALQNVMAWLALAWVLTRWLPQNGPRPLALWAACLFSHGLLCSVRFSLLDGPSLLLLACAAIAAETGRHWLVGAILGAAGLGRETNLLGVVMIAPPRDRFSAARVLATLLVAIAPFLLWQDYLWSIYRSWSFVGGEQIAGPLIGYLWSWQEAAKALSQGRLTLIAASPLLVAVSLTTQLAYLVLNRSPGDPWWKLALAFGVLMLIVDPVVWLGYPGAVTRVMLPLTVGFNIMLARKRQGFWLWYVGGNLHLLLAPMMLG